MQAAYRSHARAESSRFPLADDDNEGEVEEESV